MAQRNRLRRPWRKPRLQRRSSGVLPLAIGIRLSRLASAHREQNSQ